MSWTIGARRPSVKASRGGPGEPGAQARAADANVLALAHGGQVPAPYRFVDIAAGELQLRGDLHDGEDLVAGIDAGVAGGRVGHVQQSRPEGCPQLLEGAE